MKVAAENHVLPIDDRTIERFNAAIAGRPDLMGGRTSLTVYPGMVGMNENAFINIKNRSFTITADVEMPTTPANGVILAQAGRFGGWSLWMKDGKPVFTYNFLGLERYDIRASRAGSRRARRRSDSSSPTTAASRAPAAPERSSSTARRSPAGRIERTQPNMFSGDDGADVGMDEGTPVSEEYAVPAIFTGTIGKVTIDIQPVPAKDATAVEIRTPKASPTKPGSSRGGDGQPRFL